MLTSAPPLTRPLTTSLRTGQPEDARDTVAAILARLDFNDPQAVRGAHQCLTETPALAPLCERVFDRENPAGARHALATLILYKRADDAQHSGASIAHSRVDAVTMVFERLSRAGKDEVRQSVGDHAGQTAFAPYLTELDRGYLADCVRFMQGETFEAAIDHWRQAVEAYQRANQDEFAAAAYARLGHALLMTDECLAAQAYQRAASRYTSVGRHEKAAKYLGSAGLTLERVGHDGQAANLFCLEADACERAAQAHTQAGQVENAKAAWRSAASACHLAVDVFNRKQQYGRVTATLVKVAKALMQAGEYGAAAVAWGRAAETHHGQQQYELAAETRTASAIVLAMSELPTQQKAVAWAIAAAAWTTAARAWKAGANHLLQANRQMHAQAEAARLHAAVAYLRAAHAEILAGRAPEAQALFQGVVKSGRQAVEVVRHRGQPEPTAVALEMVAQAFETGAALYASIAPNLLERADRVKLLVHVRRKAAQAYRCAAECYRVAQQPIQANEAEARAVAALGPEGAFRQKAPSAGTILAINALIGARLTELTTEGCFHVGTITFYADGGHAMFDATKFDVSEGAEWCGIRNDATNVTLIGQKAASELISDGYHPIRQDLLEVGDVLRGTDLRDLLQPGWRKQAGGGPPP